jgi:hypothetical protein
MPDQLAADYAVVDYFFEIANWSDPVLDVLTKGRVLEHPQVSSFAKTWMSYLYTSVINTQPAMPLSPYPPYRLVRTAGQGAERGIACTVGEHTRDVSPNGVCRCY